MRRSNPASTIDPARSKTAADVLARDRLGDVELRVAADQAEHRADVGARHAIGGEREHLIERAQRVAHAAFGGPRHERQRRVLDLHAFAGGDLPELLANRRERQRLQLEDLRPRLDRGRHRVQFGRRHHELHVRRRLFDGLQQGVERALRQPVDFVDDEHLVAVAHRRDRERLDDDLADGVDAGVGGAVDLEDVQVAAFGDLHARIADAARVARRSVDAVQRPRQDARRRRLADAARAGEDERLREPAAGDRVLQRIDDAALADDVLELLRTPFAGESYVGHDGCKGRRQKAQGTSEERASLARSFPAY